MSCNFCEYYTDVRSKRTKVKEETGCNMHLRIKLYEYWTKNGRVMCGNTHKTMKLRFCPECGRKISETK